MVSILDCCRLSVNPGMPGELPPGFRAGQQAFRTDCCRSRGDGGETERHASIGGQQRRPGQRTWHGAGHDDYLNVYVNTGLYEHVFYVRLCERMLYLCSEK
ncbi:hypothetical protein [Paenibacillus sp. KS1]|uniref:hypothetical protein n=1 Tax=Paenibacillus sp. KS1 TaxID=1849249 RepID=UPI001111CD8F|nr:hypothetical protein [Paenibacillus sp. KS1]